MAADTVLPPAVAGRWYPEDPPALARLVDGLLEAAEPETAPQPGETAALIAPHAGFSYSGAVAASAFVQLRGRSFERIVLIGPSHYFAFRGAAVPDASTRAYRTPLGDVPIDRAAVASLARTPGFTSSDETFAPEHALEAELPFLQRVLAPGASVVPILMGGGTTASDASGVADAMAPLLSPDTLVVVSSDFTHFGPRFDYVPFTDDVPARVRALDLAAIGAIEAGDGAAFSTLVHTTGATICGHRAIEVLLRLPGAAHVGALMRYDTSGRMTGAWDHSVSYAGIAMARR